MHLLQLTQSAFAAQEGATCALSERSFIDRSVVNNSEMNRSQLNDYAGFSCFGQ